MIKKPSPPKVTSFQKKVYHALKKVPQGKVTTYKELARGIGCKSPRAVGQALRVNPFSPQVPCHRVISSDFSLGGFRGKSFAIKEKLRLLEAEGVEFFEGLLKDKNRVFYFKKNSIL